MINIKSNGQRASSITPARSATLIVANPFGNCAVARVATKKGMGFKVITPMNTVPVTYRAPRTQYVLASQYELLSKGF